MRTGAAAILFSALAWATLTDIAPALDAGIRQANRLREGGDISKASQILEHVLRQAEKDPSLNVVAAVAANNLAQVYHELDRDQDAERLFVRSVRIWEGIAGNELERYARPLNNLASHYIARHQPWKVDLPRLQTLAARLVSLDPKSPELATTYGHLASLAETNGALDEAITHWTNAVNIWRKTDPLATAIVLTNLCSLKIDLENEPEAASLLDEALINVGRPGPPNVRAVSRTLANLGALWGRLNQAEKGLTLTTRALMMAEQAFGPDHMVTADILATHSTLLKRLGRKSEAKAAEQLSRSIVMDYEREHPERKALVDIRDKNGFRGLK